LLYLLSFPTRRSSDLYAFDASCRSACLPLWSYATDNTTGYSSPAAANGVVYIGSYDHKLYAFDTSCRSACQPLWSYITGNAITSDRKSTRLNSSHEWI